jgi:P27 family predicted phage terminase small subunit
MTDLQPPAHLSEPMRAWWCRAVEQGALGERDRLVLTSGCESWDRANEARELIAEQGITLLDRFGQVKPNPAVTVERDSRASFVRIVSDLNLDQQALGVSVLDALVARRRARRAGMENES